MLQFLHKTFNVSSFREGSVAVQVVLGHFVFWKGEPLWDGILADCIQL